MTGLDLTVDASEWGPAFWTAIHAAGFSYPDKPTQDDRAHMQAFVSSLGYVLPCPSCRDHFRAMLAGAKRDGSWKKAFESRDNLSRWFVSLHNKVNTRIGKDNVSYADVVSRYCNGESTSCPAFSQRTVTRLGFPHCEIKPGVWRFLIGVVVTLLLILGAIWARKCQKIVARCQRECPKIAAR
jgi:hypothetical protein